MFRHRQPHNIPLTVAGALRFAIVVTIVSCPTVLQASAQAAPSWPPITPQDLSMTDNPFNPGEPATILFYEVQTDSVKSTQTAYKRIKIFREEGKKYADVEIPYFESMTQVEEIHARVTFSSGKSEDFNGPVYDKEVVKLKKYRFSTKTFTLPNVAVGSIIEYSYRLHWRSDIPDVFRNPARYLITDAMAYPAAEWEIQQALSVQQGHFLLRPLKGARTVAFSQGLPKDATKQTLADGTVELKVSNVPALLSEEYSPPEESLKTRADVYYTLGMFGDGPEDFWRSLGRHEAEYYDGFIGKHKDIQKEVDRLIAPGDSEETKLRKIYARVQQIRALTYEPEKSKKERKQESIKENKNVEEVLNRGYAFGNEINLVFIALARAAGFQAFPVRVVARNRNFFSRERLDASQLNSLVVGVAASSGTKFFDPATLYCPYGLLPWEETDAGGIVLDSFRSKIGNTPKPQSKDAVTRRLAELRLDSDGNLEGKLTLVYEGQEALTRRLKAIDQDEAQKRKDLEEAAQNSLPPGAIAKLLSTEAWTTAEAPLKFVLQVQVPNYANKAGQRLIFPVAVFHTNGANPFASARRTYPVYFGYPAEVYDEVTVELPEGLELESLPAEHRIDSKGTSLYDLSVVKENKSLRVKRFFTIPMYYLPVDGYANLRRFYETVRTNDEQQAILRPARSATKN